MSKSGVVDNNKELIDVIDENDNVIGQMTKKDIHEGKNILHREVAVIIYDSNNNILLQQRSFKKKYFPGKWTPTAIGHVISGQTPLEAAHMELKEEMGFDADLAFVEKRKYVTGDHISLGFLFKGEFPKGVMISPDRDEVEKANFFTFEDITKMIKEGVIDPHAAETLNRFMQNTELNFSELIYLYADKYVPEASFLQNKEELPNGKKLNVLKLGNLVAEAAFAYLYLNGFINLELRTKKLLGFIPKKEVTSTKISDGANLTSLEKSIFDLSDGLDVFTILHRLIGQECPVPWSVVTSVVKESLVKKEFLIKEQITKKILITFVTYKYHINVSKNISFNEKIAEMNNKLKEFSQKDFYKLLVKSIDSGINSQKEKPDDSD